MTLYQAYEIFFKLYNKSNFLCLGFYLCIEFKLVEIAVSDISRDRSFSTYAKFSKN